MIGDKDVVHIIPFSLTLIEQDTIIYLKQLRGGLKVEVQPKDTSKGHFYVSLAKSFIRIGAGCWLMQGNLLMAGVCLILAEVLGIVEELV